MKATTPASKIFYDEYTPPTHFNIPKLRIYSNASNDKLIAVEYVTPRSQRAQTLTQLIASAEKYPKNLKIVKQQLNEYFTQRRKDFDLPMELYGTHFQISVWKNLIKIAYGDVCSYKTIAASIPILLQSAEKSVNHSLRSRAVGQAVGRNPISIIIPCHRVLLSANGALTFKIGNYGGGIPTKQTLLKLENVDKSLF